jgi:hypothetical protein
MSAIELTDATAPRVFQHPGTPSLRPTDPDDRTGKRFAAALGAWAGGVVLLGASGLGAKLPTRFLPAPIALATGAFLAAYTAVPRFRAFLDDRPMRDLTAFNAWRVPAALAFFRYGRRGLLPPRFVANAGWGDLIAGALALPAVLAARRWPRQERRILLAFHLFSFADFVVAVGTGARFTLRGDRRMDTLKRFPMITIPMFGVPVTGALSVIALLRLFGRTGDRGETPSA